MTFEQWSQQVIRRHEITPDSPCRAVERLIATIGLVEWCVRSSALIALAVIEQTRPRNENEDTRMLFARLADRHTFGDWLEYLQLVIDFTASNVSLAAEMQCLELRRLAEELVRRATGAM